MSTRNHEPPAAAVDPAAEGSLLAWPPMQPKHPCGLGAPGGTTEALFRSPPMSEVDRGPDYYGFPLQMRLARRQLPTAEQLA